MPSPIEIILKIDFITSWCHLVRMVMKKCCPLLKSHYIRTHLVVLMPQEFGFIIPTNYKHLHETYLDVDVLL